mmetsp:Transcript_29026/g.67556  ORF Transcript_29026/g.67556 Transcript_29026/m.67556 type:complete len:148 (+) Transcript_29026:106-549(+)
MMEVDFDDEPEERRGGSRKVKGRGAAADDDRYAGSAGVFEGLADDGDDSGPAKSIEGWVVLVSGVHEEAQEDDVFEAFATFGDIKNLHLNLDRRTGFVKGYAFIEYDKKQEAAASIKGMDGQTLLDSRLSVDWAFAKGPGAARRRRR